MRGLIFLAAALAANVAYAADLTTYSDAQISAMYDACRPHYKPTACDPSAPLNPNREQRACPATEPYDLAGCTEVQAERLRRPALIPSMTAPSTQPMDAWLSQMLPH